MHRGSLTDFIEDVIDDRAVTPTNFFLELLRNADDNEYQAGIRPEMTVTYAEGESCLYIANNEVGFRVLCSFFFVPHSFAPPPTP